MSAKIRLNRIDYSQKPKDDLIDEIERLMNEKAKLEDKKEKAGRKIEQLEKELKKYKNAHTPSSKKSFEKTKAQGLKVGRKKGKKSGHKGRTRPKDNPQRVIEVTTGVNPKTGNKNIKPTGEVKEIIITDFKIVKVVKQYNCHEYIDMNTGELFIAKHKDMPHRGIFGRNVLAFSNYLRFECKVVPHKIASIFTSVFNIPITTPTAMDLCTRVAEEARPEYEKLEEEIKEEKAVNGDETSAKLNGLPGWLWGFFSLNIALFVFNKERGGDIVERILGKEFKGILGADGWSTYKVFCEEFGILLQRCWAHAIREVKEVCMNRKRRSKSLEQAYEWFCDIFDQVKKAREIKSQEIREQLYMELIDELDRWIQVYSSYRTLRKVVNTIQNGKEYWFTCVLHPEIDPTNNLAERMLRIWVVMRKIIGCLRSEQGQKTTETMLSLINTWKLRKLNPYEELKSLL